MKTNILFLVGCMLTGFIFAQDWNPRHPGWTDSFEANGFCWCNSSNYDHGLDTKTVEINGVDVNIVDLCAELQNHPDYRAYQNGDAPYNDIQCGNGPANDAADEAGCPGRTDIGPEGCNVIGPTWDMDWLETRFGASCTSDLDAFSVIQAEDYCGNSGVQTNTPATKVGWIDNGDWVLYENVDFDSGANFISISASSGRSGGAIQVRTGAANGTLLGTVAVSGTGGWDDFETFTSSISTVSGVQDLYLVFTGGSGSLLDVDYFQFSSEDDEVVTECDLPWTTNALSVTQDTLNYTSEVIDISCVSSVSISMNVEGVGPMETADYLNIYYSVNGGSQQTLLQNTNTISSQSISVSGISGNTLELIVNAYTSFGDETYTVSNIVVSEGDVDNGDDDSVSATFDRLEAEDADAQSGTGTENSSEGTENVGWINNGDWLLFENIDLTGAVSVDARVAARSNHLFGDIEVRLGSATGTLIGTMSVGYTGGNQVYTTVSTNISSVNGVQDVYFVFTGNNGGFLFNVNWMEFSSSSASAKSIGAININDVTVFPNPVESITTISGAIDSIVRVYDITGKELLTKSVTSDNEELDLSLLPSGIYYGQVLNSTNISTFKLLKK